MSPILMPFSSFRHAIIRFLPFFHAVIFFACFAVVCLLFAIFAMPVFFRFLSPAAIATIAFDSARYCHACLIRYAALSALSASRTLFMPPCCQLRTPPMIRLIYADAAMPPLPRYAAFDIFRSLIITRRHFAAAAPLLMPAITPFRRFAAARFIPLSLALRYAIR
jgi:hypothetical protein